MYSGLIAKSPIVNFEHVIDSWASKSIIFGLQPFCTK